MPFTTKDLNAIRNLIMEEEELPEQLLVARNMNYELLGITDFNSSQDYLSRFGTIQPCTHCKVSLGLYPIHNFA